MQSEDSHEILIDNKLTTIQFFSENIDYNLENVRGIVEWIKSIIDSESKDCNYIDFVLCDDSYLLEINKKYLNHDYYTDIITFPLKEDPVEANIFISIDRVKDNGEQYKVEFIDELHRVIIHGVLHLIGYDDKSDEEKKTMRAKENECLSKRFFI